VVRRPGTGRVLRRRNRACVTENDDAALRRLRICEVERDRSHALNQNRTTGPAAFVTVRAVAAGAGPADTIRKQFLHPKDLHRMASMRTASAFRFSVFGALAFACVSQSALSSPLLPPDHPVADRPESSLVAPSGSAHVDVADDTNAAALGADIVLHTSVSPRRLLADFALKLRNIAYVRGGRELSTGFDCSGFVRYVYQQALGSELPGNSTSQFAEGDRVDKNDLKMGDLVFFKTHGKRVSHVGMYLDNGLFIHAPSRGKRVRIDHLDESYWAKRFAGAKRPDALT
jgi:cell wall-associated NlpC family hydrolase